MRKRAHVAALLVGAMTAPAAASVEWTGEVGAVSDYRYRGLSLSEGRPSLQAGVTIEAENGLYGSVWGSTLGNDLDTELDLVAGYSHAFTEQVALDLSGTYYVYPADDDQNYFEGTAALALSNGPAEARLGFSYVPPQRATRDEDGSGHENGYAFVEGGYALPKTPVTLKGGLGYERGWFDGVEGGGKWDWTLGAEAELSSITAGIFYVGSNADASRHTLVGSLFLNW